MEFADGERSPWNREHATLPPRRGGGWQPIAPPNRSGTFLRPAGASETEETHSHGFRVRLRRHAAPVATALDPSGVSRNRSIPSSDRARATTRVAHLVSEALRWGTRIRFARRRGLDSPQFASPTAPAERDGPPSPQGALEMSVFQRRDRQGAFSRSGADVAIRSKALPDGRASDSRFFDFAQVADLCVLCGEISGLAKR